MDKQIIGVVAKDLSTTEPQVGFNIKLDESSDPKKIGVFYYDEDGVTNIDNLDTVRAASTSDDLMKLLEDRNYNLIGSRRIQFLTPDQTDTTQTNLCVVLFDKNGNEVLYPVLRTTSDSRYQEIISLYEKVLDDEFSDTKVMGTGELIEGDDMKRYYNFSMIRDFVEKSTTANVLSFLKDKYVDVINLNTVRSLISFDNGDMSKVSIKIGIQFTDKDNVVNCKDLVFETDSDFHHTIDEVVTIEVHDNCIRLFSDESVSECIITYCYLQYDGIH